MLKDATVYVIGDSFMRHIYIALLRAIRGDEATAAFTPTMPARESTVEFLLMF